MGAGPVCNAVELAALVRAGDPTALDAITRCFGDRLLAAGRAACRNDQDGADAVQDALISAGTHLKDWRGEGSVEGWVRRMVIHACHRRRRGRKNDPALHDAEAVVVDSTGSPEERAGLSEVADALREALETLPALDRSIVWLAEVEGYTGPQIAEQTGLRPDAVRARLSRARAKLRERLGAMAPG